jgi:hypothetical protein
VAENFKVDGKWLPTQGLCRKISMYKPSDTAWEKVNCAVLFTKGEVTSF